MTKNVLSITITGYILVLHRCAGNRTTTEPAMAAVVELLSDQNQIKLAHYNEINGATPQGYEHFNPAMLENVSLSGRRWDRTAWYLKGYNHEAYLTVRMCYMIQTSWRRGKRDVLNYYKMRDLYMGTLDYEIGYVTHVIISKYMDTLEVFDIVRHRFLGGGEANVYAPPQVMFYIYMNILENTRSIIALCNMLHEVKKKYKYAIGDTPWDQVMVTKKPKNKKGKKKPVQQKEDEPPAEQNEQAEEAAMSYQEQLEKQERDLKKKIRAAKKYQKQMELLGRVVRTTTNATRRPAIRYWKNHGGNYDYGWSIEKGAW